LALLPFSDRTHNPLLDFAAAGLPHLLGMELRRAPGVAVIGYYRVLEHVAGPAAPLAEWVTAAAALGAEVLVRGELEEVAGGGGAVVVHVRVERAGDGTVLAQLDRTAPVESVPDTVRALAAAVASAATGRAVSLPGGAGGAPRAFEVERELQLGIALLEADQLVDAEAHLREAIRRDPASAEAHFRLAVTTWWESKPPPETLDEIELALAGALDAPQRGFMEGLRLLVRNEHPGATAHFRKLAEEYPDDRDILYGLFEALFHGGNPAEAMVVYRRVCELSPRFRLGLYHPLSYYTAHGDTAGMEWALARADAAGEPQWLWRARMRIARRDFAGALEELRALLVDARAARPGDPSLRSDLLAGDLVAVTAVSGKLDEARALAKKAAGGKVGPTPVAWAALESARGAAAAAERWRALEVASIPRIPTERGRAEAWVELVLVDLPAGAPPARLEEVRAALAAALTPEMARRLNYALALALLAGAQGDAAGLAAARASPYPEVLAVAEAYGAARAGDASAAAAAWRRAAAFSGDGKFLLVEELELARALRAAGDYEGVLSACGEVVEPRLFEGTWGAAVGPCLLWEGDAARALGRPAEARAAYERLATLRSAAGAGDALRAGARAGLAVLSGGGGAP
ncbi:MAG TPA: tetratricopeptide repeat protein, partial [Myxococcota bacterium]|nr:tetratricopeptide repeat protein [Myxococcota bacterium]